LILDDHEEFLNVDMFVHSILELNVIYLLKPKIELESSSFFHILFLKIFTKNCPSVEIVTARI
jgi:hypothetical protein